MLLSNSISCFRWLSSLGHCVKFILSAAGIVQFASASSYCKTSVYIIVILFVELRKIQAFFAFITLLVKIYGANTV